MPLINDVKSICDALDPGWRDLLKRVTNNQLDILQSTPAKLKTELTKNLPTIDRTVPGFADFQPTANKAITAGLPGHSLLYHALACSSVHPTTDGSIAASSKYATLEQLETIENFIYSLASGRTDLAGTFVAVFAYQYREASRTSHGRHADLAFSRTGVARVGTEPDQYDGSRRGFWVVPPGGKGISVLPARYGVFLAKRSKPINGAGTVQGGHTGANDVQYVFPVHKLFGGKECLDGQTLNIKFHEFHRNEKLRKIHRLAVDQGGIAAPPGFDVSKHPYVRDSLNDKLLSLRTIGAGTVLVVPEPAPGGAAKRLVRTVSQQNSVSGQKQIVHYFVPAANADNRFTTSSLQIPSTNQGNRLAPEYVNMRHKVNPTGPANQVPQDLNQLNQTQFISTMNAGGFAAAHFVDDSCDGCVEAVVTGLTAAPAAIPAFSLITAPDFLPLADQIEIETDSTIELTRPLCKGRLAVNPTLPLPSNPQLTAFQRSDKSYTAVVGAFASGSPGPIIGQPNRQISFLPDGASDVFAPGWDTSRSGDSIGPFLTSSGLGSPFPEDAKLCAALASFWPAVAPDNGRTFGNENNFSNQVPMLDEELGFHPKHERVSTSFPSYTGWDGEFGPFFEKVGTKTFVNYVAIERSDYVSQALADKVRVDLTAEVQSEELIARHQALEKCQQFLPGGAVALVVLRKIADWQAFGPGVPQLTGGGHLLEFAELQGNRVATNELSRVRRQVKKRHLFHVAANGVAHKAGSAAFVFHP